MCAAKGLRWKFDLWWRCSCDDVHRRTTALAQGLAAGGVVVSQNFFDTIRVTVPGKARAVVGAARARGITVWEVDSDTVSLSVDETTSQETVEHLATHMFLEL